MKKYLLAIVLSSIGVVSWAQSAGTVDNVRGATYIERAGQRIKVEAGMQIQASDRIVTESGSTVGVTLSDQSRIAVGQKTSMDLEKYNYDSAAKSGAMTLRILRGTVGVVTGLINKTPGNLVEVKTKTATAGIRGTEFIVEVPE